MASRLQPSHRRRTHPPIAGSRPGGSGYQPFKRTTRRGVTTSRLLSSDSCSFVSHAQEIYNAHAQAQKAVREGDPLSCQSRDGKTQSGPIRSHKTLDLLKPDDSCASFNIAAFSNNFDSYLTRREFVAESHRVSYQSPSASFNQI
jgi:hypothetical protein